MGVRAPTCGFWGTWIHPECPLLPSPQSLCQLLLSRLEASEGPGRGPWQFLFSLSIYTPSLGDPIPPIREDCLLLTPLSWVPFLSSARPPASRLLSPCKSEARREPATPSPPCPPPLPAFPSQEITQHSAAAPASAALRTLPLRPSPHSEGPVRSPNLSYIQTPSCCPAPWSTVLPLVGLLQVRCEGFFLSLQIIAETEVSTVYRLWKIPSLLPLPSMGMCAFGAEIICAAPLCPHLLRPLASLLDPGEPSQTILRVTVPSSFALDLL